MQSQEASKIKKALDKLLDLTYEDSSKYKHYRLLLEPKEMKSKHGQYDWQSQAIQIYNFSRKPAFTMLTCLHELAHHVQIIDTGNSDHTEAFYVRFYKLLLTGIGLGWITALDIEQENDASDCQKLEKYFGSPSAWSIPEVSIEAAYVLTVKNAYAERDYLKANHFKWFALMQGWQKTVDSLNEAELFKDILINKNRELIVNITNKSFPQFSMMYYLIVKNGYEQRQVLRKLGYTWQGFEIKKCWVKKIVSQTYHEELAKAAEYGLAPQLIFPKSKS